MSMRVVSFGVLVLALLTHHHAVAGDAELSLGLGTRYVTFPWAGTRFHGFGSAAFVRYGLSDEWNLYSETTYAAGFARSSDPVDFVCSVVGIAYVVDVTSWVPELGFAVGYLGPGVKRAVRHDFALTATFRLEYRAFRDFGVGVSLSYLFPLRSRFDSSGILSATTYAALYVF